MKLFFSRLDRRIVSLTGYVSIVILIIGLFSVKPVFAVTISPVKIEIAGDPGQTLHGEIELFNEEEETKTFYSSVQNFEARGESGAPYFLPNTNEGLASWISIQKSIALKGGERKIIPYTIQIPKTAEAGGYFAAIFWGISPPQPQGGGQVAIGGRLGMLVLLNVTGEFKENGGLLSFEIEGKRRVVNSLPVIFEYRFANNGNGRVKPMGEVNVKNIFGFNVAQLEANKSEGNVLPRSIRKFKVLWHSKKQKIDQLTKQEELALLEKITEEKAEKKGFLEIAGAQWRNFAFGPYKAQLNLTYGRDDKTIDANFWFFVIPWQLLSIIIAIFALSVFFFFIGIRKYNSWVIKKAQIGKF